MSEQAIAFLRRDIQTARAFAITHGGYAARLMRLAESVGGDEALDIVAAQHARDAARYGNDVIDLEASVATLRRSMS